MDEKRNDGVPVSSGQPPPYSPPQGFDVENAAAVGKINYNRYFILFALA
jgi:hypothetical protein